MLEVEILDMIQGVLDIVKLMANDICVLYGLYCLSLLAVALVFLYAVCIGQRLKKVEALIGDYRKTYEKPDGKKPRGRHS